MNDIMKLMDGLYKFTYKYAYHIVMDSSCMSSCFHIDGLVQKRHNSSALAMELCLSWPNHRYMGAQKYVKMNKEGEFQLLKK